MFKLNKKFWIILALLLVVLVLPSMVGAQTFDIKKGIVGNISCAADGSCGFCDWIDLFVILQKVILSLFGGLALIMMIWAGQGLITAGGNETKISESKKLIGTTILGVVIVLAGYFLVNVLIGILLTPSGTTTGLKTILNGSAWAQTYCRKPSDPNYCKGQPEGRACITNGQAGVCVTQFGSATCARPCAAPNSCQIEANCSTGFDMSLYCSENGKFCCLAE